MGVINHPALPPAAAARIASSLLNRHSAGEIAAAIEILIDALDLLGGDPDAEDASDAEDDFALSALAIAFADPGPGCTISDQDAGAYVEWTTMRGSQKAGPNLMAGREDDEDDDPAEEDDGAGLCDEDGINTGFDRVQYTRGASGPGCAISDEGGGNIEDEPQMAEGLDYFPTPPRYGIDQTRGPINGPYIARRHDLCERLSDAEGTGAAAYARSIREDIARMDRFERISAAKLMDAPC